MLTLFASCTSMIASSIVGVQRQSQWIQEYEYMIRENHSVAVQNGKIAVAGGGTDRGLAIILIVSGDFGCSAPMIITNKRRLPSAWVAVVAHHGQPCRYAHITTYYYYYYLK